MRRKLTFLCMMLALSAPFAFGGLVGYYTFEGNILDMSGNGNHGSFGPTAPTLTASGFTGSAYQFGEDANAFITVPININPNVMPQVTFGAWVNLDNANDVIRGIISHDTGNFDRTLDLDNRGPVSGTPQWCAFNGAGGLCGQAVTASEWVFLAVRYDAVASTVSLTVNGTHITGSGDPDSDGTNVTYIGRNPNFDLPFTGRIDNVFFFDEYLSNDQLNDIYRNGINPVPEPSTFVLCGLGVLAAFAGRFRRRA